MLIRDGWSAWEYLRLNFSLRVSRGTSGTDEGRKKGEEFSTGGYGSGTGYAGRRGQALIKEVNLVSIRAAIAALSPK